MSASVRTLAPGVAEEVRTGEAGAPPTAVTGRRLPALDGLRALAVGGVMAYHLGLRWASGGYLGVDLFFVLSGFLITTLLAEEWVATGTVRLGAFWARRARRLLPALFLLLVALGLYVVLLGRFGASGSVAGIDLSGLRGDALATLLYVANWHAIFAHQSYFARFAAPSPLEHTWSLAIEEQFYLVWPPVLVALLVRWRRRRGAAGWRWAAGTVAVVAGLASVALMAVLHHPGTDPTRVYFGTDTRLFDLLAGALVAVAAAARRQPSPRARGVLHAAGVLAAGGLAYFWVTAGTPSGLPANGMFTGGFAVCAALAALVVADVRQLDHGPLGAVLSIRPLRWVGTISYGIYLWHWPVFVTLTAARSGLSGPWLDVARVALTLAVATASYYLVERPLRRRRLAGWPRFALAPLAAAGTACVVVVATLPSVAVPAPGASAGATRVAAIGGAVPGAGGYGRQQVVPLPPHGPGHPLRVTVVGDSVARVAEPAIAAALGATGEVRVTDGAIDGFGLNVDGSWRRDLAALVRGDHAQLVLATWSWDDSCTAATPTPAVHYATFVCALQHPRAYAAMLETAVRAMLETGGARGVMFLEFPPSGPVPARGTLATPASGARARREDATRAAGQAAWNRIVQGLPARFPGKVMYLPVAPSVLLRGRFSPWLPPAGRPRAPRSQWVRIRMVDDVHLCPAGAARYADAVLADLTAMYRLSAPSPGWATGAWTGDHRYRTPPGSCPDDHPPG